MGVGTNVQDRAIALHHLDAPWRPADVAQRDGRILRQGNLNPQVEIIRYVTERSFDGYMWQTLERKARFIGQVMHGRLDTREIADIGDTALSFSEVKAIATGNPLLIDKAEADAALARLQRGERAHLRNQDALRHAIGDFEAEIARLTVFADAVDTAIARRQDTRGENFTMTVDQVRHDKRADAGQHVKDILEREAAGLAGQLRRAVSLGQLGGFPVNADVHRSLGTTNITLSLEGAPGTTIDLPASGLRGADPVGLVTRLENRLTQLETRKASALADIEHARRQITHARSSIGQPFPHAEELAAARERVREIDEALDRMAQQDPGRAGAPGQEASSGSGPHESGGHPAAAETGTASGRDDRHISAQPEQRRQPSRGSGRQPSHGRQPRRCSRQPGLPGRRPGPGPAADRPGRRPGPLPCRAVAAAPGADRRPAADPGRPGRARRRRPAEGGQAPRRRPPARPPHASHLGRRPGRLPACPASLPRPRTRSPGVRPAPALHGEPAGGPSRRGRATAGNLCAGRPGPTATIVAIVTSSQPSAATGVKSGGGQRIVIGAALRRGASRTATPSRNRDA